jgi:SAM-dependent methyltransferase
VDVAPTLSWRSYRESIGDRSPMFAAIASTWDVGNALYPGCYLDLSPSTAIDAVTYVDTDRRSASYFADSDLVRSELAGASARGAVEFLRADYTRPLPLAAESFDLLISLYAGPVWEHCRRYLRPGGLLLANTSHGDASIAALDPDLELVAAVQHRDGRYRLDSRELERYLVPRNPAAADADVIRRTGRGIAYTRTAFAYLFQGVRERSRSGRTSASS